MLERRISLRTNFISPGEGTNLHIFCGQQIYTRIRIISSFETVNSIRRNENCNIRLRGTDKVYYALSVLSKCSVKSRKKVQSTFFFYTSQCMARISNGIAFNIHKGIQTSFLKRKQNDVVASVRLVTIIDRQTVSFDLESKSTIKRLLEQSKKRCVRYATQFNLYRLERQRRC